MHRLFLLLPRTLISCVLILASSHLEEAAYQSYRGKGKGKQADWKEAVRGK